jgi:hypothetical protein
VGASFVWADKGENSLAEPGVKPRFVREFYRLPSPTVAKNPLLPLSFHDRAQRGRVEREAIRQGVARMGSPKVRVAAPARLLDLLAVALHLLEVGN